MKTNNLIQTILLSILFWLLPYFLIAQWYPQTSDTNLRLHDVCFTDNQNGWAIGDEGIVLRTGDGGSNWDEQFFDTNDYLNGVFFIDPNQGWIVGGPGAGTGIIYNTVNGGVNWEVLYSDSSVLPLPMFFNDVCFIDADNGWVVGYGLYFMMGCYGTIMHTVDGGETWDYQEFSAGFPVSSVQFLDSLRGWVVGGDIHFSTGQPQSMILSTDDGGNTWTEQINTVDIYPPFQDVFFTDSLNGFAAGGGLILKTSDGGISWDTSYSNSAYLYSIYFSDQLNGWAVGSFGLILTTDDGGDSWVQQNSGTSERLRSVFFTDQNQGWIVGDEGIILHTENGGVSYCLPEGITFYTQEAIDNFQTNYPGCSEIEGNVTITGSSTTNLVGLDVVTSIGGNLAIGLYGGTTSLTNLSGLDALTSIGGFLAIWKNQSLTSLTGLEGLTSIGSGLFIGDYYWGSPAITNLTGLDNVTTIGGDIIIQATTLNSLSGLGNVEEESIENLTIRANVSLSDCEVQSICSYLASPNGTIEIHNNAPGCNSPEEVQLACETTTVEEIILSDNISIKPNPFSNSITIQCELAKQSKIVVKVYNQFGQQIEEFVNASAQKGKNNFFWNAHHLPPGIYYISLKAVNELITKKVIKLN